MIIITKVRAQKAVSRCVHREHVSRVIPVVEPGSEYVVLLLVHR
jgi:hypothetical protein